jgi:hypothetical protein
MMASTRRMVTSTTMYSTRTVHFKEQAPRSRVYRYLQYSPHDEEPHEEEESVLMSTGLAACCSIYSSYLCR